MAEQIIHRWYTRPVLFVGDIDRALHFYVDMLGFAKRWHEAGGTGGVCQVDRAGCEIILCEEPSRQGGGRLFVELTAEGLAELRRGLAARSMAATETWWGSDVLRIDDPDGNELLFPVAG